MSLPIEDLTPQQIVHELDKYIIGQAAAKRAVAVALRNRYRRQQLPKELREEIIPKNILMMGPTGVGKTEIARRLAHLARAPFIKVEATKFTEVGYVGRDVESMVRDLAAMAVRLVEQERSEAVKEEAQEAAIDEIVGILDQSQEIDHFRDFQGEYRNVLEHMTGGPDENVFAELQNSPAGRSAEEIEAARAKLRAEVVSGERDHEEIEIYVEEAGGANQFLQVFTPQGMEEMGLDMNQLMGGGQARHVSRRVTVAEAKDILTEAEAQKRLDKSSVMKEAVLRAEETGIIFIDEIDKVAMESGGNGPAVSREGVQRDLLPIIEGSTVPSKFGPIRTDHILFIAAGAFHEAKPSDLIPELQGRLPIRVELEPLGEQDLRRILKEPRNALTKQYEHLLSVEGIKISFTDPAIAEIAHLAAEANDKTFNIGARRLMTLLEKLLEDIMFAAPDVPQKTIEIDAPYVREKLAGLVSDLKSSRTLI